MVVVRCSLGFKKLKVKSIPVFAIGVKDGLYGNTMVFPMPTIAEPIFIALINTYNDTLGIYEQGGKGQFGAFDSARTALLNALDLNAKYVDTVAVGDENIITLAGYMATKGTRSAAVKPVQATGATAKADETGVIIAECAKQNSASSYGCILVAGSPLPAGINISDAGQLIFTEVDSDNESGNTNTILANTLTNIFTKGAIDFTVSRKKTFSNLTRGVTYYFYFFVINSKGVGKLSLPAQGWCL